MPVASTLPLALTLWHTVQPLCTTSALPPGRTRMIAPLPWASLVLYVL
jgi:hypothetical protein